jgi:quinol monooxygenase YgiN
MDNPGWAGEPYTPKGPLTILARVRVGPGKQEEFRHLVRGLSADIARFEHGCLWYCAHHVLGSDSHYVIMMRFRSWADYEAHGDTAHMKGALPALNRLLDGAPQVEIYGPLS